MSANRKSLRAVRASLAGMRSLRKFRALLAGLIMLLCACPLIAVAADAPQELHGHSDTFAGNGVTIAWAVLRGATEETTLVVLRVAADPALFARIAADGVDPFTKQRQVVVAERPLVGLVEVRIPRARFADFPRTELRFHAAGAGTAPTAPTLIVFYLGVPDTTPEFVDEARLEAYLAERIARLSTGGSKTP
jgi:hypothetical protein